MSYVLYLLILTFLHVVQMSKHYISTSSYSDLYHAISRKNYAFVICSYCKSVSRCSIIFAVSCSQWTTSVSKLNLIPKIVKVMKLYWHTATISFDIVFQNFNHQHFCLVITWYITALWHLVLTQRYRFFSFISYLVPILRSSGGSKRGKRECEMASWHARCLFSSCK